MGLLGHFEQLWQGRGGCRQRRVARRAQALALSSLLCPGRRTITGLLTTSGAAFRDWSAAYRVFSAERLSVEALFAGILRQTCADGKKLVAVLDDTLLPRSGKLSPPAVAAIYAIR
ncbi:MAG: transposase [Terriglobales bacterium]